MDWVVQKLVAWLIANLTEEMITEWADKLKAIMVPWIRTKAHQIIADLRVAAADSATPVDDLAVDAFEKFLDAMLPDNPGVL